MKLHRVKTHPLFFTFSNKGLKPFEIRKNDRGYSIGDVFVSQEYDPEKDEYTGREMRGSISYITDFMQHEGYVVLGILWDDKEKEDKHIEGDIFSYFYIKTDS